MLALQCLVAALSAVLLDVPGKSVAAASLLIGGAIALASPAAFVSWAPPIAARVFPVPSTSRVTRAAPILAGAALGVPAAVLAIARLGPIFPAPAAWALPATLAAAAIVALAPAMIARRSSALAAGERAFIAVALAASIGSAMFVWVHTESGTLIAIRPGTGALHVALFGGTLVVTALATLLLGLAADDAWTATLRLRTRLIAGAASIALGAGCLFADRRLLVDLYPHVHTWLTVAGISCVAAGAAFSSPRRLRERAGVARIAGSLVVSAALVATAISGHWARPGLRAEIRRAPVGKVVLAALATAKRRRVPVTSHPLLAFDQRLNEPGPKGQPNLLLITVDALRDDQLDAGFPSLDRLGSESIRFRHAYTQGTRTAVAIGALMRGTYSAHIDWQLMIYRGGRLQDPLAMSAADRRALKGRFVYTTVPGDGPPMLSERLRKQGLYTMATAYAGDNEFFRRGGSYDLGWDAFEDMAELAWRAPTSDKVAKAALAQLEGAGKRRWFQWVHFYDPHEANGSRAKYESLVRAFDVALGRILDELSARGLSENTVVVLSADHGEALGEHGHRGHASSLYEEQARVPLLIRVPGLARRTIDEPVAVVDVSATLAVAAGADTRGLDGVNLWPAIFSGSYPARRPVFLELHRYHSNRRLLTTDLKGVVLDGHKLIVDRMDGTEQLFSLKDDPLESKSILDAQPDRAAELRAVLGAFVSQAEAEHPLP